MNFLAIIGIAILVAFFFYMNDIINRMYMDIKYIKKHINKNHLLDQRKPNETTENLNIP